ncbi:translation initiation factor IF-2 [Patescibacteria group bacterium]|nr:translation initiation factor IF-2 [Patescibacteria group bacterium]
MNISQLARQLRVSTEELRSKLPELGFDIGNKAIKIPDKDVGKITAAWHDLKKRQYLQKKMEDQKARAERKAQVAAGVAERVALPATINVRDFSAMVHIPIAKVMQELMRNGILASLNEKIDYDTAAIIAEDLGFIAERAEEKAEDVDAFGADKLAQIREEERAAGESTPRAPVIVVMGHVDHGKTSLLDVIRKTNVVAGEAGGITQHIGAYQVERSGRALTFIDTPGHEAFTVMRSRGAKVADIAILVVAADDGVQPQTREAADIIKAAKLPFVVAINKIDKEEANLELIKGQLAELGFVPEDWGGKTVCVPVSAKQNKNIDGLLDVLLLVADMEKANIVANPDRPAAGTIIESRVDKNQGPTATVIVQTGTLRVQDYLSVRGYNYGRVRAMKSFDGSVLKEAPPSTPVKIIGLKEAPSVGDILEVATDLDSLQELRSQASRKVGVQEMQTTGASTKGPGNADDEATKATLNIIVKSDVLGSLEALLGMVDKVSNPHVGVKVVGKGLGNVTDADVLRAESANAVVYAFNVKPMGNAAEIARDKNVAIEEYSVIYKLFDGIVERLKKLIPSEKVYTELGTGEVLALFKKLDKGQVIGARVKKGKFIPGAVIRVLRDGQMIGEGKIEAIQAGKMAVRDVLAGQECGISFIGKAKIEPGDQLEAYQEEIQARTLIVDGAK